MAIKPINSVRPVVRVTPNAGIRYTPPAPRPVTYNPRPRTRDESLVDQHRALFERYYGLGIPDMVQKVAKPRPDPIEERIKLLKAEIDHKRLRVESWNDAIESEERRHGVDSLAAAEMRHRGRYHKSNLNNWIAKHQKELDELQESQKPREPDICDIIMQEAEQ